MPDLPESQCLMQSYLIVTEAMKRVLLCQLLNDLHESESDLLHKTHLLCNI